MIEIGPNLSGVLGGLIGCGSILIVIWWVTHRR